MPEKEFTEADSPTSLGSFSSATLEDRNRFILGQNPVMKNVGGRIRRALANSWIA